MARYDFVVLGSGPAGRRISAAGSIGEAVIRDLSQEGARIESNLPLGKFQRIRIDAEAIIYLT